jgi:hypothetical protein
MLRRTVRNLHRGGSEAYATVEQAAGEFATVRLGRTGARYTNLPVIGRVSVGDRVIVDFSLGDRPYVRPVTVIEDEVIHEDLLKIQERPDPPLISIFYSSLTGAKGYNLGVQVAKITPPAGWYEIDYDDSSWTAAKDPSLHSYGGLTRAYLAEKWPDGGVTVGEDGKSGALYEQTLVRTQFYMAEEHGLPTVAIMRFDYDDYLYEWWVNENMVWGPDLTAEAGPGKPGGPFELNIANYLRTGKNVIAAHLQEGVWSIWPWNHKLEFIIWQVGTNLAENVSDVLQEESISTIRAEDTGGSMAPLSSGIYIPDFDSVTWGDEGYLQSNPAAIASIGLTSGNDHVFLGNVLGKYAVSVAFDVQIADAASYPRVDAELYIYFNWTYPGIAGSYSHADWTYASRELWLGSSGEIVPVSFSAHLAIDEPSAFLFPRIVRGSTPDNEPDTMLISNLRFDVMKIATISDSARSTYGSHWDEWYEKYPDEL